MRKKEPVANPGLPLNQMLGKIVMGFVVLVLFFLLIQNPGFYVDLLQGLIEAAQRIAKSISQLDLFKG